ncbi:MAG: transglycosylase SLT domain-containing protein [Thiohalocapsa sp.]
MDPFVIIHKASRHRLLSPAVEIASRPFLIATLAIIGLTGCASKPTSYQGGYDPSLDTPRTVSARDYGYVRPARDVKVIGDGERLSYGGRNSADLWDRVRRGPGLGISHHDRVERAITSLKRNPSYLTDLARRARPYLHVIVGELERAGVPTELALLPEVESRYNPRAISPKSASGMWQFMPYTGTEMGLVQNGWYDGRNDILASTRGAIAYLTQLRDEFDGDWALALASYNAGPGRVRSAQRANRARGKPTDFWSLNLPNETEQYVPKLLAIADLVREPARYGMRMPTIENRPRLELVEARGQINLASAARHCGVSVTTLKSLNPGLKRGMTPAAGPHRLLVPLGTGQKLRKALAKSGNPAPTVADGSRPRRGDS